MLAEGRWIRSVLAVCLVVLGVSATHAEGLEPGQVVLAFVPALTGDAAVDFSRPLKNGETTTLYLIAGPMPESVRGYSFDIRISEAANLASGEVRAPGEVAAHQNSIGNAIFVAVSFDPACRGLAGESVLAEIDVTRHGEPVDLRLTLGPSHDSPDPKPAYRACSNDVVPFDTSAASTLTVAAPDPVAVHDASWDVVKRIFR